MNVYRAYPKGKNRIFYVARKPDASVRMFILRRVGARRELVLTPAAGEPGVYVACVLFERAGKYLLTAYENNVRTTVLIAEVA